MSGEEDTPTIHIHSDMIIGTAAYNDTLTLTLPIWHWIALAKLAEYHHTSTSSLVATWVADRIDRLATHSDDNP